MYLGNLDPCGISKFALKLIYQCSSHTTGKCVYKLAIFHHFFIKVILQNKTDTRDKTKDNTYNITDTKEKIMIIIIIFVTFPLFFCFVELMVNGRSERSLYSHQAFLLTICTNR